ncbi:MAG: zinc-binding dehydrogenase, partial [Atopobiaceae bacterium]|nr:zinc-binding dehydrogenase [Atopobiaceae bacterium]
LGDKVDEFKIGDRVAGEAHVGCGKCDNCKRGNYTVCLNYGKDGHDGGLDYGHRHYGFYWQGANAEYNVYKTSCLHKIPDNVSYDVASMCDCAGVAFHGVLLAGVTPGGTSVVFGPGAIGLCAMMECKALGSGQVIMIGRGEKLKYAGECGADVLIDFEKEDPIQRVLELTNGVGADEVMECSGAWDSPLKACKLVRKKGSVALIATYHDDEVPIPGNIVNFNEIRILGSKANPSVSEQVLHFFSTGDLKGEKLITHTFDLEDYNKAVDLFEHRRDGAEGQEDRPVLPDLPPGGGFPKRLGSQDRLEGAEPQPPR